MQQKILHKNIYCLSKIDDTEYSQVALERKKKLELFDSLMHEGCTEQLALEAIGFSRSKYYRLKQRYHSYRITGLENQSRRPNVIRKPEWSSDVEEKICALRNKFRFWGKEKIAIILEREYKIKVSISTVGRILSALVKKRKIKPVAFYSGKYTPKPRAFTNHAQRLPTSAKGNLVGELVQIDHMSIRLDSGKIIKHFDATCTTSRFSVGKAYCQATSFTATNFLDFIVEKLPFPVRSIQVDGGAEFRGAFEVERSNGTVKYEFYSQYDKSSNIGSVNDSLQQFMDLYNNYRPHRGLQGRTPMEYWLKEGATQASFQSHMY